MSRVEQIAENIYVLSDLEPADGSRSWLPADASGFEPFNKFVMLQGDFALLLETGAAAHSESVQHSLREIIGDRTLVILPTRSELESIGNMGSIIDNFPRVELLTTTRALPPLGLAHMRPERRQSVKARRIVRGETLGSVGFPTLDTITPVIRILNTIWIHDRASGVLFTSDFFSNDLLESRSTPTIRRESTGLPDAGVLRRSILARFDWLERARTDALKVQWDELFARIKPAGIAPSLGRVSMGRELAAEVIDRYRRALFETHH
jgi:flavorubredoxin